MGSSLMVAAIGEHPRLDRFWSDFSSKDQRSAISLCSSSPGVKIKTQFTIDQVLYETSHYGNRVKSSLAKYQPRSACLPMPMCPKKMFNTVIS